MWLVGEDEVTVFLDIHRVVQGDLLWGIVLIDDLCSDILKKKKHDNLQIF